MLKKRIVCPHKKPSSFRGFIFFLKLLTPPKQDCRKKFYIYLHLINEKTTHFCQIAFPKH